LQIAKLRSEQEDTSLDWVSSYPIGGIVSGKIQERKDYGYIVSLPDHEDIVGFITHYQGTLHLLVYWHA
jgi:ribosomal protein S1